MTAQRLRQLLNVGKEHRIVLAGCCGVVVVFLWYVTHGSWKLFEKESFGLFYDAQAESLLQGRLDVASEAIQGEEFRIDGKMYGYFGITPALFRIPAELLLPQLHGKWSRLSMTVACLLLLTTTFLLLNKI